VCEMTVTVQALQEILERMTEKIWVLKRFVNTDIDDSDVTFSGRVFHSRAAATGKARSPMVEMQVPRSGHLHFPGQQAMMLKQSGYADGPRLQMTDGIPQRGTAELSGVDICIPEQPA